MKPALFIGRFQPFHLGHLDALRQIFEKENYIIIGIGSAEDDYTPQNPFTAGERYRMIEETLLKTKLKGRKITRGQFTIVPVRNIHHYSLWVKHLESLLPPFGKVYTASPIVQRLFREEKKYSVVSVQQKKKISATDIRQRMLKGKPWDHLVPKSVAVLITKSDGVKRLREI